MNYKGSKRRLVKDYKPIILQYITDTTTYVEPFVGGCNMISEIDANTKIGNDINLYLIALLKYKLAGFSFPNWVDLEEYKRVKENPQNYPLWYVGYVGFICCYRSNFMNSYNGIRLTKLGERNYLLEAKNALLRTKLDGIKLVAGDYRLLAIPENSVIYCDAPYRDTDQYKGSGDFDYNSYYDWLRQMAKDGHKVFVSELNMPSDFKVIKEVTLHNCMNEYKFMTERLYTL